MHFVDVIIIHTAAVAEDHAIIIVDFQTPTIYTITVPKTRRPLKALSRLLSGNCTSMADICCDGSSIQP